MKKILSLILAILMLTPFFSLVGCKQESDITILRICNCEDYIDESLLDQFEEENPDIDVVYSTYGTNENLYNELVINPNSYDLVVPSEYMIEKLANEGRIQPLFSQERDAQMIDMLDDYETNVSSFIKDRLKNIPITQGIYKNAYNLYDFMVGYMWGTMGWVYDTAIKDIENYVSSWAGVFNNSSLDGKITIKDAVRDSYLVGLAMVYQEELTNILASSDDDATKNAKITEVLNRTDSTAINLVGQKLSSLKSKLYGFEVDSGKNDIVLGRINAYVAWSGDATYAIDLACGDDVDEDGNTLEEDKWRYLSYSVPEEGSNIWFDGFVMPSGSTNYDAVYKFLEFISRPENVFANMDYTGYTGMVASGEFDFTEYDENGEEVETRKNTTIFSEMCNYWELDERSYLLDDAGLTDENQITDGVLTEYGYQKVDLSYFFKKNSQDTTDYNVIVSKDSYGRLIAQYPTKEIVDRCAVMKYYENDQLLAINEMWEGVKGETFPIGLIIGIIVLVVILAVVILLYRFKDKIKWVKINIKRKTYAEKHNLKLVKKEFIK